MKTKKEEKTRFFDINERTQYTTCERKMNSRERERENKKIRPIFFIFIYI
jgi:hypothetical protein